MRGSRPRRPTAALELDDLERLALAAYLTGNNDASTNAWMRAHQEAIRRNDPLRAAGTHFWSRPI
jgi:hypothetical protein